MRDIELTRFNMIEQQIRPCDVLDSRVLELLKQVRREHFVPSSQRALAFMDVEIPLGHGAKMWFPKEEGRALQEVKVKHHDRALEIGTGSGYFTALLAAMAEHVTTVEIEPALSEFAQENLKPYGYDNITFAVGDGAQGWGNAQYDVIVLTGSTPVLPAAFKQQLAIGGRLFAVVGDAPTMRAQLITRLGDDAYSTNNILETSTAPLRNALQPERFIF